ncbi:hypothetical protein M3M33_01460 [Loigolactobacillus coryniformis]|jgi:electron transfer flavoprotein beta subunit|uniref:electron transfer flavoprotein subunit beta/FixA family protein n=1 Tax=Loigolactobacillus coryniformis TaxID=1610 RepID=UPI00201AD4BD|nr:hypothetical protein [Loigolactobacillus coryniformis]MCL5457331.1 hypothetical protein [Loigolactobacillus coryniformis]
MNIVVFVKAVVDPDLAVDRLASLDQPAESAALILNPYDKNAIETALQLKEKYTGTVTAVSLGESVATEKALREALSLGVDAGIKINGVAGAATGYILGNVPLPDIDFYLTGREAADNNQGVVGAGIAAALGLDFIDNVDQVELLDAGVLTLTSRWDQSELTATYQAPVVISVTDTVNQPRLPSFRAKIQAKKAVLTEMAPVDFLDAAGLARVNDASVTTTFELPPTIQKTNVIFNLEDDETAVDKLLAALQAKHIL